MQARRARVAEKRRLSCDTVDLRLELCEGGLNGLEAGAHVDVHLPGGLVRQYSVWDWSPAGDCVNIAVKYEASGRGGSQAVHALEQGNLVYVGGPRNNFRLDDRPVHKILIAGGIGATPIVPMARRLVERGAAFQLYYVVRSGAHAAMDAAFRALHLPATYQLHCTDADGRFDIMRIMASAPAGSDVYACGPDSMLKAILENEKLLRGGKVHLERFAVSSEAEQSVSQAFEIELASSGAVFRVGEDQTVLEVLRQNGMQVSAGCTEGLCGSCIVDVVSGDIDHRDSVLSEEEQAANEFMCTCVSRARSKKLVLRL